MKKSHKFAIAGVVIFLTIAALIYTALKQSSVYYMTVPELRARGESLKGEGVRASGQVMGGSISYDKEKLILNFKAFEKGQPDIFINVTYNGIKPDSFKEGVQVIIEGKYNQQENLFKASILLVKCPSRYEGKTPPPDYKHGQPAERGKV